MVYKMVIYVDGGCRGNGRPWAIGAAAAVVRRKWGRDAVWTKALSRHITPTNQRAEISAIILALQTALERYDDLDTCPRLSLKVYSDSKYAVGCMNEWIYKWYQTNWTNARGEEVANRDLIEEASDLGDRVNEIGNVEYIWIPRSENQLADEYCNGVLDEQEEMSS